jgi:hypothetical protein
MEQGYTSCSSVYLTCTWYDGTYHSCTASGWYAYTGVADSLPTGTTTVASTHNICDPASNCSGYIGSNSWT